MHVYSGTVWHVLVKSPMRSRSSKHGHSHTTVPRNLFLQNHILGSNVLGFLEKWHWNMDSEEVVRFKSLLIIRLLILCLVKKPFIHLGIVSTLEGTTQIVSPRLIPHIQCTNWTRSHAGQLSLEYIGDLLHDIP